MKIVTLCIVLLVLLGVAASAQTVQPIAQYGERSQAVPVDMTPAEMAAIEIAAALNRYGCYLQPGQLTDWNGLQVPIVRVVSWYVAWGNTDLAPDGAVLQNVCVAPAPGGEAWLVIKPKHEEGEP
jgi:hypothetical protein